MRKKQPQVIEAEPEPTKLYKLDLGCGENKREGFTGVDLYAPGADIKCDLMQFPWRPILDDNKDWHIRMTGKQFADESVEEIHCSHFFEHMDGPTRIPFMDECWRVLIPGGKMTIIVPYWSSPRSIQDPMHKWPPISEESFLYFNKDWRTANKLNHYLGRCDFDFTYGYMVSPETASRNQESQQFYITHYVRAVNDLQINLVKKVQEAKP